MKVVLNCKPLVLLAGILTFFGGACKHGSSTRPQIIIKTDYGNIEAELYPAKAPKTVAAFLSHIEAGYYKHASFYRVIKDEELPTDHNTGLIQGGSWPARKGLAGTVHEPTSQTGLSHLNGVLSMARTSPGTATTEFFICIGDQTQFDANNGAMDNLGFAAFGKVTKGMNAVRRIQSNESVGDKFKDKITIENISRL